MCGIIGYKCKKNGCEVVLNGLKDLEYRGYDSWGIDTHNLISDINKNFGHVRWASENFINHTNFCNSKHSKDGNEGMNILNLITKENYYAQTSKYFQNILNEKIINKQELLEKINISRKTLYRITKKENYWCNIQILFDLIKLLSISEDELIKNIQKIKTKNSFPIIITELNINSNEFFRILGHILGDGGIHVIESEGKYRAFYVNNEQQLLDSFCNDTKKAFGELKIYSRKRIEHGDEIWLPSTVGFTLYKLLNYQELNKKKRVPQFVFNSDKKYICQFLQAIFDDESTISVDKHMIVISLGNKFLLEDIRNLMLSVDINCNPIYKIVPKNRSIMYQFSVTSKDNLQKFREKVNFLHPLKRKKLNILINKYR